MDTTECLCSKEGTEGRDMRLKGMGNLPFGGGGGGDWTRDSDAGKSTDILKTGSTSIFARGEFREPL